MIFDAVPSEDGLIAQVKLRLQPRAGDAPQPKQPGDQPGAFEKKDK